jgi:hypothetical protein
MNRNERFWLNIWFDLIYVEDAKYECANNFNKGILIFSLLDWLPRKYHERKSKEKF